MRWFRANRTFGCRLALFALAVQLVLSFGHIHREDIYGPAPPATTAAGLPTVGGSSSPADRSSKHDDYCAICATTALLNSSFIAAAPQLVLPTALHLIEHVDAVARATLAPRRPPFQSRAPPVA
jgi:hypothetical protein